MPSSRLVSARFVDLKLKEPPGSIAFTSIKVATISGQDFPPDIAQKFGFNIMLSILALLGDHRNFDVLAYIAPNVPKDDLVGIFVDYNVVLIFSTWV